MDKKLKNTLLRRLEIIDDASREIIERLNSEASHNWDYIREKGVIGMILLNKKWGEDIFSQSINLRIELQDLAEIYITKKFEKEIKEILIRRLTQGQKNHRNVLLL